MDLQDVMGGRIPFSYPTKFKQINTKLSSLARKLADNVGSVTEKAVKRTYWGEGSSKEVLSDMIKIVEENLPQYITDGILVTADDFTYGLLDSFPWFLEPSWLDDLARNEVPGWDSIADEIWNFFSQSFAESTVKIFSSIILAHVCKRNDEYVDLETRTSKQENFIFASSILFNLSFLREDIIHAPLAHDCRGKVIEHVTTECGRDDLPRLKQRLQSNAMWRCNDQIGNYDLLNKLLIAVACGHASTGLETKVESVILVVKSLLDCAGAQLGSVYLIDGSLTALEHAVRCLGDDDICKKVVEFFLKECDGGQQLVNTPNKYRRGRTPLHRASD